MFQTNVLALVGSLRAASLNRQLAELAAEAAPDGQYGGVWAHDESRKSIGVAGADVVDVSFSLPATTLDGRPPHQSSDVVAHLGDVLTKLAADAR